MTKEELSNMTKDWCTEEPSENKTALFIVSDKEDITILCWGTTKDILDRLYTAAKSSAEIAGLFCAVADTLRFNEKKEKKEKVIVPVDTNKLKN